jgi:integrase
MPRPRNAVPTYRRHKQSGQAIVTLYTPDGSRRDMLLGPYDSPESRVEYARLIGEYRASPAAPSVRAADAAGQTDLTVSELCLLFLDHAERHYRKPDGTPTQELEGFLLTIRTLRELYGHTRAAEFDPLALKAVRDAMARQPVTRRVKRPDAATGEKVWAERVLRVGLARPVINQRVGRIKRIFKWAVSEELVPESVYRALATVAGLQRGRTDAREPEPVSPVPDAHVDAALPYLLPPVGAMVKLQRLTGMRPNEACRVRACDLEVTGDVWLYRPGSDRGPHGDHKTAHRGRQKVICLGKRAQEVIRPFLTTDLRAYLFSPAKAMAEFRAAQRAGRKTPVQPSQQDRAKAAPKKRPGPRYTRWSYAKAVATACAKAGVPAWSPGQLRHSYATHVRKRFGLDGAQVALGHAHARITEVYAEKDLALAERIAREIG